MTLSKPILFSLEILIALVIFVIISPLIFIAWINELDNAQMHE
jgi:hypothetical protein